MRCCIYLGMPIVRVILSVILFLVGFLAYTIYSQDLSAIDIREYEKNVVIYTKNRCGYCDAAKELMRNLHIDYIEIDISYDRDMQSQLEHSTGQRTVPYIFIKERFIGGYQEFKELKDKGALVF